MRSPVWSAFTPPFCPGAPIYIQDTMSALRRALHVPRLARPKNTPSSRPNQAHCRPRPPGRVPPRRVVSVVEGHPRTSGRRTTFFGCQDLRCRAGSALSALFADRVTGKRCGTPATPRTDGVEVPASERGPPPGHRPARDVIGRGRRFGRPGLATQTGNDQRVSVSQQRCRVVPGGAGVPLPCRSSTAGPLPRYRTRSVTSPVSIRSSSNPSTWESCPRSAPPQEHDHEHDDQDDDHCPDADVHGMNLSSEFPGASWRQKIPTTTRPGRIKRKVAVTGWSTPSVPRPPLGCGVPSRTCEGG